MALRVRKSVRLPIGDVAEEFESPNGWLYRVGGPYVGNHGAVRPATVDEVAASRAAAEVDGGDGIFGRTFDSETPILPGQPGYALGGVSYFRVRAGTAAA